MKKYIEILKKCPLFSEIDDGELSALLGCLGARVESFDKKYTVFAEGKPAKYIGIVLSGSVQTVTVDYYGNRNIIAEIGVSEMIGEAFACAETDSIPVSVIANEPSEIMLVDCRRVLHSCSNACHFHQQMIFNLMKNLATKNIMFHKRLEITSKRTTRDKLLAYLDSEAKRAGSNRFRIPFDRQELADYLEVERSGLSSEIGKLKREGIIDNKKDMFVLL